MSTVVSIPELGTPMELSLKKGSRSQSRLKLEREQSNSRRLIDSSRLRQDKDNKQVKKQNVSDKTSPENKTNLSLQNQSLNKESQKYLKQKQDIKAKQIKQNTNKEQQNVEKKMDEKANQIIQQAWQNSMFFNQIMNKKKTNIDLEEMPFLKK